MMDRYYPPLYAEEELELLDGTVRLALDYALILREYPADNLRAAWLEGMKKHTQQRWPAVAVFVDALEKLAAERVSGPQTRHDGSAYRDHDWRPPTPEERKLMDEAGGAWHSSPLVKTSALPDIQRIVADNRRRVASERETRDEAWRQRDADLKARRAADPAVDAYWRNLEAARMGADRSDAA